MFTSNGGGRWQRPSERASENLWANEVVKDSAELEQILIWQILRMDELINPQCPALKRLRATAYSANLLQVDDVLQVEGLPAWSIQYLNANKDDGFRTRDRITKNPTQLCLLLEFEKHGLRWKTMAENGYLREELDLIAQAASASNLSEIQVLKWMEARRYGERENSLDGPRQLIPKLESAVKRIGIKDKAIKKAPAKRRQPAKKRGDPLPTTQASVSAEPSAPQAKRTRRQGQLNRM